MNVFRVVSGNQSTNFWLIEDQMCGCSLDHLRGIDCAQCEGCQKETVVVQTRDHHGLH